MITNQGNLNSNGTKIIQATEPLKIFKINISNPLDIPYTYELYKYNADSGLDLFRLFKIELNAGDFVNDTSEYLLDKNDYLFAKSNSSKTQFIIEAIFINDTNI